MMSAASRTKAKNKNPTASSAKVKKLAIRTAKASSATKGKKRAVRVAKAKKPVVRAAKARAATKKTTVAKATIRKNKALVKKPINKTSAVKPKPVAHADSEVALEKAEAGVERATVKVAKLTNDLVEMRMKRSAARRKAVALPRVSSQNALNSAISRVEATRSKLDTAQKILSQEKKQLVVAKARDRLQTRLNGLDARVSKREATYAVNIEKRLEIAIAKFRAKKHAEMKKAVVKKMNTFARTISKKKASIEANFERSQRKRAKKLLKAAAKDTD